MVCRILAVSPPGSMEKVLSDLRGRIFSTWGAVSALALPPVIPLLAWPDGIPDTRAAALLAGCARAAVFELGGYMCIEGYHYLTVRCDVLGEVARLARETAADPGPPHGPPFPCAEAFLLAGPDLAMDPGALDVALPIPAERRFRSYGLSVLVIRTEGPPERWWDLVSWEEVVHVPVKANGRPAPGSAARPAAR